MQGTDWNAPTYPYTSFPDSVSFRPLPQTTELRADGPPPCYQPRYAVGCVERQYLDPSSLLSDLIASSVAELSRRDLASFAMACVAWWRAAGGCACYMLDHYHQLERLSDCQETYMLQRQADMWKRPAGLPITLDQAFFTDLTREVVATATAEDSRGPFGIEPTAIEILKVNAEVFTYQCLQQGEDQTQPSVLISLLLSSYLADPLHAPAPGLRDKESLDGRRELQGKGFYDQAGRRILDEMERGARASDARCAGSCAVVSARAAAPTESCAPPPLPKRRKKQKPRRVGRHKPRGVLQPLDQNSTALAVIDDGASAAGGADTPAPIGSAGPPEPATAFCRPISTLSRAQHAAATNPRRHSRCSAVTLNDWLLHRLGSKIIPPRAYSRAYSSRQCPAMLRLTTRLLLCACREELEALDLTELAAVRPASDAVRSPRLWQKLEREVLIEVRSQVCDMAVRYPSRFCLGS